MKPGLIAWLAAAAFCSSAAQAADIYRWVDDAGKTHLSDTVPDRYRARATRVDSAAYELSPAERARAQARAREAKAAASRPAATPVPATSLGGPAGVAGAASRPAVNDRRDCAGWQQRYTASQECFAPFRLVNGGIRPEAFQKCTEVPDPARECGIERTP